MNSMWISAVAVFLCLLLAVPLVAAGRRRAWPESRLALGGQREAPL